MNPQFPPPVSADDAGNSALMASHPGYPSTVVYGDDPNGVEGRHTQSPSMQISLQAILRRKWTFIIVTVLIACGTVPLIWMFSVPKYKAAATIRVAPVLTPLIGKDETIPFYKSYLNTQVTIIKSPRILERVLDQKVVQETAWYKQKQGGLMGRQTPRLQRLRKSLAVSPGRGTELITVAMYTNQPADAKIIVDTAVDEYLKYHDSVSKESNTDAIKRLNDEKNELRKNIQGLVLRKEIISKDLGTESLEDLRSSLATNLSQLEERLREAKRELKMRLWRMEKIVPEQPEVVEGQDVSKSDEAEEKIKFADDPEWRQLNDRLDEEQHTLKLALARYGESHPAIQDMRATIDFVTSKMKRREKDLEAMGGTAIQPIVPPGAAELGNYLTKRSLEFAIEEASEDIKLLEEDVESQRRKMDAVSDKASELAELDGEISKMRDDIAEYRDELNRRSLELKAPAQVSIAADAIMPHEPHRDRRIMLTVMAIGAAFMAGLGAAFLRAFMDPSIRQASDVAGSMSIPFLGYLPRVRFETELLDDSSPLLAESMRMIRTALLDRVPSSGGVSVLVTSSGAKAGKTSVSILLAKSLAGLGKKTLLIDADLRRTSLSERIGVTELAGLKNILAGDSNAESAVVKDQLGRVDIVPAGTGEEELVRDTLANGVFSKALRQWKRDYDFVILDSPPVLPVADARILASQVDSTILTVRAAHCRRADAVEAVGLLTASGGRPAGTILVGADDNPGYIYGGYAEYGDPNAYRAIVKSVG